MGKLTKWLSFILLFLFIGCGSGSSSNESFNPSMNIDNVTATQAENGDLSELKGTVTLTENNSYFTNVDFSKITSEVGGCEVDTLTLDPTTIDNGKSATFDITLKSGCKPTSSYIVSFLGDEKGSYTDTVVTSKTQKFTLSDTVTLTLNTIQDIVEKDPEIAQNINITRLVVLPKSFKVMEKEQVQELKVITLDKDNRAVSGTVSVNLLIDDDDNQYGTLDKYVVTTDSSTGEATILYTAPSNVDDFNGDYYINYKVKGIDLEKNTTVSFVKQDEDTNATEYVLKLVVPNSFAVDSEDSFSVKIVKQSDNSVYIDDDDVKDVNVTFTTQMIAFNSDKDKYKYEYDKSSAKSLDIYSKTYSGIEFVDVNATIFNGEKNVNINQTFKIVLLSGPISAISINYLNSSYDSDNGLFSDNYSVHAVDKYSNPANAGSKIYFGAVNGIKVYGEDNGTIDYDDSNSVTEFNLTDTNLTKADVQEDDTLIILASENRLDGSYLGGWTIKELIDNNHTKLNEDYIGKSIDLLKLVIGNEKRYNSCSESLALIDLGSTDGTYEVNNKGIAYITAKYDPFLVGKTITFYANSNSKNRVGVAQKRILSGTGVIGPDENSCTSAEDKNKNCKLGFSFGIKDGEDLENTLLRGTFYRHTDNGGECNITSESNLTDCDGDYYINVSVEKNNTCTVKWNGRIDYGY